MDLYEDLREQILKTKNIVEYMQVIYDFNLPLNEWEPDKDIVNHHKKLLDKMPKLTDGKIIYEYRKKKE